ncbi:unnamed protein product [Urochloa humidicola]
MVQPLALLLPFVWSARVGSVATAMAVDAEPSASRTSGKEEKTVALVVLAGSPIVAARRQESTRKEFAIRPATRGQHRMRTTATPPSRPPLSGTKQISRFPSEFFVDVKQMRI